MTTTAVKIGKGSPTDSLGTGRRKTAIARVRVRAGSGKIAVNGRSLEDYFPNERDRADAVAALVATAQRETVDVSVTCCGGGVTAQAGAMMLGVARALKLYDTALEPALRQNSLLTRDGRMKERKHYGLRGARRGTQFSKR